MAKHRVVFEFETTQEYDREYAGADSIQIAHEMIQCAVKENQIELLERSARIKEQFPKDDAHLFPLRFLKTQKSLKIIGTLDNSHAFIPRM